MDGARSNGTGENPTDRLAAELVEARDGFVAALDAIEPRRAAGPGLVGDWSARELIAHLGYWAGYAGDAIHAVEQGRADSFEPAGDAVDERNAIVARVARRTGIETVRRREEAAFDALVERVRHLDPALLAAELPSGSTLEQRIRVDGAEHYREHAAALHGLSG